MENTVDFGGGILLPRVPENLKADTSIIRAQPPFVSLPVADAVSVRVGDRVLVGTNIGINRGLAVYSSVSGKVLEIKNHRAVIENDTLENTAEPFEKPELSPDSLVDYMRKISLVGMGGAGFPTAGKYENCTNVKFLLINACECEPHLSCDRALITNLPRKVIRGAQALSAAAGNVTTFICVKHRDLLETLKSAAGNESIRIVEVSKKFPQGSEKQLIASVLRREVPRFKFPKDCGAIVSNCATAAAFAESIESGLPPVRRIVSVAGRVGKCANILAPCGTSARYLLDLCDGAEEGTVIIEGGAMTGRAVDPDNAFVSLSTAAYIALPPPNTKERACIHCGGCARVCPSRIVPYKIDAAERQGDTDELKRLCADACISCGCCTYICPAKRELTAHTTQARRTLLSLREAEK